MSKNISNNNLPPQEATGPLGAEPVHTQSKWKTLLAVGTLAAGAYFVVDTYEHPVHTDVAASEYGGLDAAVVTHSILTGIPARVEGDLKHALAADTCETKVSLDETLRMYQKLFGAETAPSHEPNSLMKQTDTKLTQLKSARDKQHFGVFPSKEFNRLKIDEISDHPKIPLKEYQQTLDKYVAPLGLTTLYDWTLGQPGIPPKTDILPVNNVATDTDNMARQSIVDTLDGMSNMSMELLRAAGSKRIVFGKITGGGALGETRIGGHDIYIDTELFKNSDIDGKNNNDNLMKVAPDHENMHLLHYKLCWDALGDSVGDQALHVLNRGVLYDDDKPKQAPHKPEHSSLELPASGPVTTTRGYGMVNEFEDVATEAEFVNYGPNTEKIYQSDDNPKLDLVPLREKVALLLSRVDHKYPDIANFYVNMLQAGRLQAFADNEIQTVQNQITSINTKYPDLFSNPKLANVSKIYDQLVASNVPYVQVSQKIGRVLNVAAFDL